MDEQCVLEIEAAQIAVNLEAGEQHGDDERGLAPVPEALEAGEPVNALCRHDDVLSMTAATQPQTEADEAVQQHPSQGERGDGQADAFQPGVVVFRAMRHVHAVDVLQPTVAGVALHARQRLRLGRHHVLDRPVHIGLDKAVVP